ncbi:MAG TPA: sensor histidine kinase [Gammaproteobacteria bacterium]|nr:sensor histidine kinase [Gammaproteobacteria bacterium]
MNPGNSTIRKPNRQETLFLPGFCDIGIVFAVVLIAELLAIVLVLANSHNDPWSELGLTSLFVQWIALSSAAVLCLARPMLMRVSNTAAALTSYLLLLLTTAVVSELAYQLAGLQTQSGGVGHAGFLFRNLGMSAIISALVLRYLYVQHQWRQKIQAEAQARVQALQARIRPHFLFNSMNSIASLTRSDPVRAEQAVQDLADLFRISLHDAAERVTLEDELDVAQGYLRMEALRLGDRLQVEWDIERLPRKRLIPSLILQPLLENAVYHGIEPLPQGGLISISGSAEGRRITITISNPRAPDSAGKRQGNQIALENIRLRLQLAFGEQAGVALRDAGDRFETTLYFPREKMQ